MRRINHVFAWLALCLAAALTVRAAGDADKTKVSAGRMEYDYDGGSILFDNQVKVDDPKFEMTADRAVVFLRKENEISQIEASGQVVVISSNRTARCHEAVYTKDSQTIVLHAQQKGVPTRQAYLKRIINGKDDVLYADKITIWLDSQRVDCEPARIILDGSTPSLSQPLAP